MFLAKKKKYGKLYIVFAYKLREILKWKKQKKQRS